MRYSRNPEWTHKVAFTGAGCVGKTALLNQVAKKSPGPSIGLVGEAARGYFKSHPGIPESQRYSFYHQERIQRMAMGAELAIHESRHDHVFTDRSVFDAAVCVASTGDRKGAKKLLRRVEMWLPGKSDIAYSQIYVLDPADVPFENDPQRTEGEATRQRQHEMFLEFFTRYDISHKLLSGSFEERTETVLAALPNTSVK
ncbi:ATP-binding protein [Candidatus Saccharibacteria bacterium]|nr:ATP-binding protein [Candidatus Saccharibacteria bacterium]